MSVVLPAPDGPDTMNNVPSEWKLLDILDLLADALDLGFQFYDERSDGRRARFRAHGVDLAQHLLREEVELLPSRLFPLDGALGLFDVMREPGQLLGDVAALRLHDDFLRDPLLGDLHARLRRDLADALLERREQLGANLVAMLRQLRL